MRASLGEDEGKGGRGKGGGEEGGRGGEVRRSGLEVGGLVG